MTNRPLSIAHLVFGLLFLGAAGLWAIGAGTDADSGDIAQMSPAVLIGAGLIGLAATAVNARRSRKPLGRDESAIDVPATHDPEHADTSVLDTEEQK